MTDTTDIKALIDDVCLAAAGIHNLGRSVSDERAQGVIDFIRSKLESAFEAERQRADEYRDCIRVLADQLSVNALPKEVIEAVAALKGEQVPVAWTSQRSLETKNKIVAFTDDMSALDYGVANGWTDIVELFTAPQKPIGLRQIGSIDHDGGEFAEYFVEFTDSAQVGQAVYVIDSAIEAAGGIVKDGE